MKNHSHYAKKILLLEVNQPTEYNTHRTTMDSSSISSFTPVAVYGLFLILLAGQFDNHFWRVMCLFATWKTLWYWPWAADQAWYISCFFLPYSSRQECIWMIPHLGFPHKRAGCVVITGADLGMGQQTVLYLAQTNIKANNQYDKIFAAAFNAKACQENRKNSSKTNPPSNTFK